MKATRLWLRILALILPIAIIVIWCDHETNPNVRFRRLKKEFDEAYQATYSPLFDSLHLGNIEPQHLRARDHLFTFYYPKFAAFKNIPLQAVYKKQWQQTLDLIQTQMIYLPKLKKDPTLYNFGNHLKKILQLKDAPLNNRLQQIEKQLDYTAQYYIAAKNNLVAPDSAKLQPAIRQQVQILQLLRSEIGDSLRRSTLDSSQKQQILTKTTQAQLAVKDFIAFCRSVLFEYHNERIHK